MTRNENQGDGIDGLNLLQEEALLAEGHCAVLAGPGSGKTRVLVSKVAHLLRHRVAGPRGVACITYNNECVRELRKRFVGTGLRPGGQLFLGTVHSFCMSTIIGPFGRLFREDISAGLNIASSQDVTNGIAEALASLKIRSNASDWREPINLHRRTRLDGGYQDEQIQRVADAYESALHRRGLIDFDDMVLIGLDLIRTQTFVREALEARFPYLVVDEYQDLGYPLHRIVREIMANTSITVFAVGDEDQSIYGFAGADPMYLRELADDSEVHSVRLDTNYRCAQRTIDGSEIALAPPEPRGYKSARDDTEGDLLLIEDPGGLASQATTIADGIIPALNERGIPNGQIAILYVDYMDVPALSRALTYAGIEFAGERDRRYPRTPFTRWLEDVAAWCTAYPETTLDPAFEDIYQEWVQLRTDANVSVGWADLADRSQFHAFLQLLSNADMPLAEWLDRLNDAIGVTTYLANHPRHPQGLDNWKVIRSQCELGGSLEKLTLSNFAIGRGHPRVVTLTTLHSSKGREYDAIVIPGLEDGRLPRYNAPVPEGVAEARRVLYVGITRARLIVYLMYSGWYEIPSGRHFEDGPSRFVLELLENLGNL
ncbi:MAG: ATP-dependent helicase [Chloroflexi bacterium]|nr:ATP-dependent helicase [Chloroflexota bacterium]